MKYVVVLVLALFIIACSHVSDTKSTVDTGVELEQELNEIDEMTIDLDESEFQELEGELDNL